MKFFFIALFAALAFSSAAFADSSTGPGNAGIIAVTGNCTGSGGSSIALSCPERSWYLATDPAIGFVDGADNSAACNAAFTGPLAAGGTLYIPNGTFKIKGCVLPNAQIHVVCASRDDTRLQLSNSAGTYMFASYSYVNNLTSGTNSIEFYNCKFLGNDTNQSVANDLLIMNGTNTHLFHNNFFSVLGHALRLSSVDADGTTCNVLTNDRILDNRFNSSSKGAIVVRTGSCGGADYFIADNNFSTNGASCASAEDYQIYAEGSSGAVIARNGFSGQSSCGNVNIQGAGGLTTITENRFDAALDTSNGATDIVDVIVNNATCTTSNLCFGSYTITGNIWKWALSNTLPGSSTGLTFLQAYQNTTTQTGMVSGNHFYVAGTLAGIKPIVFSGTQVAANHLRAYDNVYSSTLAAITDPNIDLSPPFAWLTSKPTTLAGYGITDKVPYTLARDNANHTVPADTTEDTLATVTVPANTIGANGCIEITSTWVYTGNTNLKTMKVYFGGTGGTLYVSQSTATGASINATLRGEVCNRNATNSQVGSILQGNFNTTGSVSVPTSSIDTTASTTIVFTGQKAVSGDVLFIAQYSVLVKPF